MPTKTEHTPLPWMVIEEAQEVSTAQIRGSAGQEVVMRLYTPNAEFIVRAVNSHTKLVQALKDLYVLAGGVNASNDWEEEMQAADAVLKQLGVEV